MIDEQTDNHVVQMPPTNPPQDVLKVIWQHRQAHFYCAISSISIAALHTIVGIVVAFFASFIVGSTFLRFHDTLEPFCNTNARITGLLNIWVGGVVGAQIPTSVWKEFFDNAEIGGPLPMSLTWVAAEYAGFAGALLSVIPSGLFNVAVAVLADVEYSATMPYTACTFAVVSFVVAAHFGIMYTRPMIQASLA